MKDNLHRSLAEEIMRVGKEEKRTYMERAAVSAHPRSRLLVDMDGTLAKFQPVDTLETLYEEGYFLNLKPQQNVVEAVREIKHNHPEIEVYILSSVLSDSRYALLEKNMWMDKYLPEIDLEHRIYPPCGENKLDYLPGDVSETDYLLDDYTHNLTLWEPPAKGIKLLNGINHTHETWKGNMLRYDRKPQELAGNLVRIIKDGELIQEMRPVLQEIRMENQKLERQHVSDYVSEEEWKTLQFLTEAQAKYALTAGISICTVNAFPVYHGIHEDEYFIHKVSSEQEIEKLYATYDAGIIHSACVSPFYENPQTLKNLIIAEYARDNQEALQKKNVIKPKHYGGPKL